MKYCNTQDCEEPGTPVDLQNHTHHIHGYVENWVNDYTYPEASRYGAYTALFYSFLTLDKTPNPDSPRDVQWDTNAQFLYDTMTLANIIDVMGDSEVGSPYNWQYKKIKGLMDYCAAEGKRFIWALGGWSDLKRMCRDLSISPFLLFFNPPPSLLLSQIFLRYNCGQSSRCSRQHPRQSSQDIRR